MSSNTRRSIGNWVKAEWKRSCNLLHSSRREGIMWGNSTRRTRVEISGRHSVQSCIMATRPCIGRKTRFPRQSFLGYQTAGKGRSPLDRNCRIIKRLPHMRELSHYKDGNENEEIRLGRAELQGKSLTGAECWTSLSSMKLLLRSCE